MHFVKPIYVIEGIIADGQMTYRNSGGDIEVPMKLPQGESQRKLEKFKKKISDEAERKRRENALDEAIENTFPASDPVSAEQPMNALGLETPPLPARLSKSLQVNHIDHLVVLWID
jgi:hypothetical protein